jgi:hypothetical protein
MECAAPVTSNVARHLPSPYCVELKEIPALTMQHYSDQPDPRPGVGPVVQELAADGRG